MTARYLVAGTGEDGISCIVEEREISPSPAGDAAAVAVARLYAGSDAVPPPGKRGSSAFTDKHLAPGQVRSHFIVHPPREGGREERDLHYSNAVDLITIIEGSGEMKLGDGFHPLTEGDCMAILGVDHAFHPASGGCRMFAVAIGMEFQD